MKPTLTAVTYILNVLGKITKLILQVRIHLDLLNVTKQGFIELNNKNFCKGNFKLSLLKAKVRVDRVKILPSLDCCGRAEAFSPFQAFFDVPRGIRCFLALV
jgi:hypothetical protein